MKEEKLPMSAMPEKELSALLAKLNEDIRLREKFSDAVDVDAAVAIAKEAGFNVSKADLLTAQTTQSLELSEAELEGVAGGGSMTGFLGLWCCGN